MNLPAAAIGAALRPSLEMSGGGRFFSMPVASHTLWVPVDRRDVTGSLMQRGADGSVITDGAPLPKTLTHCRNRVQCGAREQVSSPAAATL